MCGLDEMAAPTDQFPATFRQVGPQLKGNHRRAGAAAQRQKLGSWLCRKAGELRAGEVGAEDPERETSPPCSWQGTSHSCKQKNTGPQPAGKTLGWKHPNRMPVLLLLYGLPTGAGLEGLFCSFSVTLAEVASRVVAAFCSGFSSKATLC